MITLRSDVTVELIRHNANDLGVVQAAQVSTLGENSRTSEYDPEKLEGLINYLMKSRHGSPFEHNSMTFFIQAPIFVFREFHRHRVGWSYNEESGRYKQLKPVFYVPDQKRNLVQVGKAGHYEFVPGTPSQKKVVRSSLFRTYFEAYRSYTELIEEGVAKEVARASLPVAIYSSMYATCNARSLMNFLSLRLKHPEAKFKSYPQREIEMVAEQLKTIWAGLMPVTHDAYVKNGLVAP